MRAFLRRVGDFLRLAHHAVRLLVGRRYWIAPLLPALWIGFQIFRLAIGWRPTEYEPSDAQNVLIGTPLTVLGIMLGIRVVAGEIDRRTLEIAYTVPGGAQRIWIAKLFAGFVLLVLSEALLWALTSVFCTSVPGSALYGALQSAVFFMVLSMAIAALFKSEAAGGLIVIVVVGVFGLMNNLVLSPFWNASATGIEDSLELLGKTLQNRIGFVLATLGVLALGFRRAENREKLLG